MQLSQGIYLTGFQILVPPTPSRRRLVRLLTHPAVHPVYIQFLLGKNQWSTDMFEYFPQIDIEHPQSIGDFFSAYIGVAHCPTEGTYLYSGSATGVSKRAPFGLVGEASRMYRGHRKVLDLGHSEIMRRACFTFMRRWHPLHEPISSRP